jgi:threonine synthase
MTFLSHHECGWCGERYDATTLQRACPEDGRPLMARYDLEGAAAPLDPPDLAAGRGDMWRFQQVLPLQDPSQRVTLGEGGTPLLEAPSLADDAGVASVRVKDEGQNPTGTFKSRGAAAAVSCNRERGAERFTVPTAGNAGAALSAYAARAGVPARVVAPETAEQSVFDQAHAYGADVEKVAGDIGDAGDRVEELLEEDGDWFSVATLGEPFRLEGKKTMGYELAYQSGFDLPDVVLYPTGGGTGLVGMWKAWDELEELGWLGPERPRLVAVQSAGCAPMVRALEAGDETAEPWEDPETVANGLEVPSAVGDFLILRALRETGGTAVAVPDAEIVSARERFPAETGVSACTEGAATLAGLEALADEGEVGPDDEVVLFNTGAGWTG